MATVAADRVVVERFNPDSSARDDSQDLLEVVGDRSHESEAKECRCFSLPGDNVVGI